MQMEAETLSMLTWGFFIVIAISLGVVIKLWLESKNNAFIWFIIQLVFLVFAFFRVSYLIQIKPEIPEVMMSEENSLSIGIIGVFWAISMLSMLIGIWQVIKKNKK